MFGFRKRSGAKKRRIFSRNVPPKVYCPECGMELNAMCMKHNGVDNGEYYENYRCDGCGCRFTAVYDGEDDGSDYIIQGVEVCNMKISRNDRPGLSPAVTSKSDIAALKRRYPNLMTDEVCPFCDSEVEIKAYGLSKCPECKHVIKPCSMCSYEQQYNGCGNCPYGED